MREQDIRAVETMCMTGIGLEALLKLFPKFPEDVIAGIFERIRQTRKEGEQRHAV